MKKIASVLLCVVLSITSFLGCNGNKEIEDERKISNEQFTKNSLTTTDALGRAVDVKDMENEDKYVGIFYSLWIGQHPSLQKDINDIQKLLDSGIDGEAKLSDRSDIGQFYFWGEPLYGYYNMQDPWIINRHVELLTMAGIDFLCIDATNTHDYLSAGTVLLTTLKKYKKQGFDVPKVMFYTNTDSGTTVNKIYKDYYASEEWDDLWFAPNGRPMIVGYTENNKFASDQTKYLNATDYVSTKMRTYFDLKESQWPTGEKNDEGMPWMSWDYPQYNHNGFIAIPVAQHSHTAINASSKHNECSRAYDNVTKGKKGDWTQGNSFGQMWENAIKTKADVDIALVTSWNEWMAQKQQTGEFVDVYNNEFSRDIELMKGGYGDNFYLQLVSNLRNFKYTEAKNYITKNQAISMDAIDSNWSNITKTYRDFAGDAMKRNFHDAAYKNIYTDQSNRNDFVNIKVTKDKENIYFLVETLEEIQNSTDNALNFMNLMITTSDNSQNFGGYNYIINRKPSTLTTSIEKSTGGYNWKDVGEAKYLISGKFMQISVPLKTLGLSEKNCKFSFKFADNVTKYDDIMDYYVTGDSAPIGRLSYAFGN